MIHRSAVAASFLRQQLPSLPLGARDHMVSATSHYDRIVAMLTPAVTDGMEGSYREFIGQLDKQQAHAAGVLQPIKEHLVGAADEIEQVLAAME